VRALNSNLVELRWLSPNPRWLDGGSVRYQQVGWLSGGAIKFATSLGAGPDPLKAHNLPIQDGDMEMVP
jgi:hypothetical protein